MKLWHAGVLLLAAGVLAVATATALAITAGYIVYRLAQILTYGG